MSLPRLPLLLLFLLSSPLAWADDAAPGDGESEEPYAVPRWNLAERFSDFAEWLDGGVIEPVFLDDGTSFFYADPSAAGDGFITVDAAAPEGERLGRSAERPQPEEESPAPQLVRQGIYAGDPGVYEKLSPDGRFWLSEIGPQLAIRPVVDGRRRALTESGSELFPWSIEGALWAPRGYWLAARRIDRRRVPREPVVHWLHSPPDVSWISNSRTGQPIERPHLYLVDSRSGRQVEIELGDEDRHLFFVGWSGDGERFHFLQASRTFDRVRLREASRDGSVKTLLDERSDTFIGALRFMSFDATRIATFIDEGDLAGHFLWISQEEHGWRQLTLHAPDGKELHHLGAAAFAEQPFEVQEVVGVDGERAIVYLLANADAERPYETHFFRVSLDGSGFERLSAGDGEHQVVLSPSKKIFIDTWSRPDKTPRVELRDVSGRLLEVLSEGRLELPEDLADVAAEKLAPEAVTALADDGETRLHGWLFRPHDFDPAKRYPVVDYIYNGPFITWAPQTYLDSRAVQARHLAALGFIVLVVDGRGTPERGKAFQDAVYRAFGHVQTHDHAAFLRQIAAERPELDLGRVGITGGSWGGYMTVRAMLLHPELYRVGVAWNPVYDLDDHGDSVEGYVGLPQDELESYAESSNLALAARLRGKLLMIHGTSDVNATFSATMKMAHALIEADRAFDLLVVPGQPHWFTGRAQDYAMKARARYLVEHLDP